MIKELTIQQCRK